MKKLKLGLLALLTCAATSAFAADDSLQIHGYGVVSGSFDKDPVNLTLHRDPNGEPPGDVRGRLGNLGNGYWHDYFTAITLNKKWQGKDGQWADYNYEFVGYGNKSMESGQNFIRFGGLSFLPEGSNIWAGRKNIGKTEPVFGYAIKDVGFDKGFGYASKNLDISVGTDQQSGGTYGIEGARNLVDISYRIGKAELGVTWVKEMENYQNSTKENQESISFLGEYNSDKFLGVLSGNTTFRIQGGKGVIAQYLNTNRITAFSNDGDTAMRVTVDGKIASIKDWTISPALILEVTNRDGERTDNASFAHPPVVASHGSADEAGIFAGISASQKINDNFSMVYEANVNNTKNKNGIDTADGTAYKIAAGPALQLEVNEWVRPIMKVSVAVVGGDKEITELKKDSEVRIGYSMETWF